MQIIGGECQLDKLLNREGMVLKIKSLYTLNTRFRAGRLATTWY